MPPTLCPSGQNAYGREPRMLYAGPGRPQLHLVTDDRLPRARLLAAVRAAAENGADWVQVRDHRAPARDLYALAHAAIALCRPLGVRVAVNDRLDVALAVRADGAQVGGRGLPVGVARSVVGSLRLGVSVHGMGDALQAQAEGADWVTLGHIFSTSSHPDQPPRGVAAIRQIAGAVQVPVIAIGGIDAGRVAAVLAAGAGGVAVISAILDTPHPGHATAALRAALDRLA